jgi:4-hydroxybenzoate polyprenyltransferase
VDRLRRFEGVLLAVNVSLACIVGKTVVEVGTFVLVSALILAALYGFNDAWDATGDRGNPRKNQRLVEAHLALRREVAIVLVAVALVSLTLALVGSGWPSALAAALILVVNALYSRVFKGVPVLDVVWCGVWGAVYAAIVTRAWPLLFVVGVMTAVCHVYQTLADREVDARNGIRTIAARTPSAVPLTLVALCAALGGALIACFEFPWPVAVSAFFPVVPYLAVHSFQVGWLLTKAYFGVLWLLVLSAYYATH